MQQRQIALAATLALICTSSAWGQPQAELVIHFGEIGQVHCTLNPQNGRESLADQGVSANLTLRHDASFVVIPHRDFTTFLENWKTLGVSLRQGEER